MTAITDDRPGIRRNRRLRVAAWLAATALLLFPLIAMQFTREVAWTPLDFAAAATLLFGPLGLFELLARRPVGTAYRAGLALALLGIVLLVWIDGAVGIAGDGSDAIDAAFAAVPLTGALVAAAGGLRPAAMGRASVAMAIVQLLIGALAAIVAAATLPLLALTLGFAAWWLVAATLFARAAH